jgi:hypothetical protein
MIRGSDEPRPATAMPGKGRKKFRKKEKEQ